MQVLWCWWLAVSSRSRNSPWCCTQYWLYRNVEDDVWEWRSHQSQMSWSECWRIRSSEHGWCEGWSVCRLPPAAHGCHILSRTDMTNSRSVAHSDVDIYSWVEPLHHFPRERLEEFDLVGAIAKKFGPVQWNPHVWAYFQTNTVATFVTCVPLDRHRSVCVPDNVEPWHFSQLHLKMLQEKSLRELLESSRSSSLQLAKKLAVVWWCRILSNDTSSHFHSPSKVGTSGLRVRRTYPDHNYHHGVR